MNESSSGNSGSSEEDSNRQTEWWWIDYLENEMDPSVEGDLLYLLEHSQEDRDSFENFRLLREWLRQSDPIGDWPMIDRLDRVRGNVMQAIQQFELDKDIEVQGAPAALFTKSLSV